MPATAATASARAAPDSMTNRGWYIANTWFGDQLISEIGRDVTVVNSPESRGTSYHVSAAVLQHDNELYGF